MVARKTGALVEAAMRMGALLGGASVEQADRAARCGRLLGLTFQARDDVLGIWGDPVLMGQGHRRRHSQTQEVVACGLWIHTVNRRGKRTP